MKKERLLWLIPLILLLCCVGVFFLCNHISKKIMDNGNKKSVASFSQDQVLPEEESKEPEPTAVETTSPSFSITVIKEEKEEIAEVKEKNVPAAAAAGFQVTAYEQPKTMYASGAVNVRKGPGKEYELAGSLRRAQEVTVTGQADTGWYEITYQEATVYVSNHYLQEELPPDPTPEPAETAAAVPEAAAPTAVPAAPAAPAVPTAAPAPPPAEPKQVQAPKNHASVIFVGDSRTVQMQAAVGENPYTWICKNGKGYKWFQDEAVTRIENNIGKGTKIVILLGVNDANHYNDYLGLMNKKAPEWVNAGAIVYFSACNPVWENPYTSAEQVETFNAKMPAGLCGEVHWINSYDYLTTDGYRLVDGLHFDDGTSVKLYQYYLSNI